MGREIALTIAVVGGLLYCFYGVYRTARHMGFNDGANFVLWCVREGRASFDDKDLVLFDDKKQEVDRFKENEYIDFDVREA